MIGLDTQIIPTARAMSFLYSGRVWLSKCAKNCTLPTVMALLCSWAVPLVPIGGVTGLAVKFAVMLVLPNLFLLLAYGRMEGFQLAKPFVLGMLKR